MYTSKCTYLHKRHLTVVREVLTYVPAQSAGLTVQRQRPSAYLNEGCSSNTPKEQIAFYCFTRVQFLLYKCKSQDLSAKI